MLLGEPPSTQADLHFRMFGIPVRVHPFFWVVSLLLGLGGGDADPVDTLLWVAVVFISILVHELGHAFMQRFFGGHPSITLYSLGGLASCSDCDRSPRSQIVILLAGPFAGFLLAAILLLAMNLTGHGIGFAARTHIIAMLETTNLVPVPLLGPYYAYFQPTESPLLNEILLYLVHVNIVWGVVNLLPIYPLDGGQIARELFTLRNPRYGIIQSLQLSTGAAALVAAYAFVNQRIFLCIMFGLLAYESFQTLRMYRDQRR